MDAPMDSTAQEPATAIPTATQRPGAQLLANRQPNLRMFVRQPWNHQHQHQRRNRGSFRRQGGNHHHTFAPRPLLFQEDSIHNMLVPSQRPRIPPPPLQQSADLTHQPGNIPHPPARLHHSQRFPPNQPTNISHQRAHLPYWRTHINPREAGVPQRFTHRLHQLSYHPQGSNILYDPVNLFPHIYQRYHALSRQSFAERSQQYSHRHAPEHSHRSPYPSHVTYQRESDFSPMQGLIPWYQETASTHSFNPSLMRRVRPQHPASLSRQQGIHGRAEDRNMHMVELHRGHRAQVAPEAYIRCLPSRRFISDSQMSAQTSCVVCLNEFEDGQWICSLPCSHEFHSRCIGKWLRSHRTCPMCRADVWQSSAQ